MKCLFIFTFILGNIYAKKGSFQNYFSYNLEKSFNVVDTISDNPINTKIHVLFNKNSIVGFYRKIATTTGCNSACLPVTATLFYNSLGHFVGLKSKKGLTKRNHEPFSTEDYKQLELILTLNPVSFSKINHPKEMTDGITGQTHKSYKADVIKDAAYTTLRLNLYNQDSIRLIQNYLKKNHR
ncbi:MAG: hypothetical protein N4A33_03575 [Bacteriovoracaceae bacterium]|jgi:hypothetical protein|nr:hypothetical protein [Bacteriovoracaceae bacterium]